MEMDRRLCQRICEQIRAREKAERVRAKCAVRARRRRHVCFITQDEMKYGVIRSLGFPPPQAPGYPQSSHGPASRDRREEKGIMG